MRAISGGEAVDAAVEVRGDIRDDVQDIVIEDTRVGEDAVLVTAPWLRKTIHTGLLK